MNDEAVGGRIFFSSTGRSLVDEDEIVVLSVGVDIGSSTSHLVFSRIVLERLDSRYVVTQREIFYQSDILLTPYSKQAEETIDAEALGAFIEQQYKDAKVDPDEIDTGALILTGVAVRRRNARKIGELFAAQAGKMVAVSAGDNLETVMAAYGSGAVARSIRDKTTVMNVDIGGGTSKIAVCAEGKVVDVTAVDVGARLVCFDQAGRIVRVEEAGRRFAAELGINVALGATLAPDGMRALASLMAERLFEALKGGSNLCRLDPLSYKAPIDQVTFSGGVSEYIYGREATTFGDLGVLLAQEVRKRVEAWGPKIERSNEGIRATVVGASQHTTQESGSTIYVNPHHRCRSKAKRSSPPPSRPPSRPCCGGSTSAKATRRSRCSCPGTAPRRSTGSMRSARAPLTGSPTFSRAATRSCLRATATSAGSWASTCARK
jgi:ethanolamine utilization protein EutA